MDTNVVWNDRTEHLLKHLYQDLKIYNWQIIAKQITAKTGASYSSDACRIRYVTISPPVKKEQWTPEEEQQLYRLHNQNGNKWAVIAQSLLGRTDNCVKNHYYSKLRKSLRTLNKIGKLYLKKCVREVSTTVLYKLTEATDQSIKQNPDITQELIELCFDLKNRLLNYNLDQKDIRDDLDYCVEKKLLLDLANFSRLYRKKSKKQKNSAMGSENLKKLHEKKRRERHFKIVTQNIFENSFQNCSDQYEGPISNRELSEASSTFPKIAKTVVLKAPTLSPNSLIKKEEKQCKACDIESPFLPDKLEKLSKSQDFSSRPSQNPNLSEVENILMGEGVLEQDEAENNKALSFFRRQASNRSFSSVKSFTVRSIQSECSNPDMFGQDFSMNSRFKDLSEIESDNHIFDHQSNSFHN